MAETENLNAQEYQLEEFWEDLLAFIEDKHVIPVIGPELNTVELQGKSIPLNRALAIKLLEKYHIEFIDDRDPHDSKGTGVVLRKHLELNDAVCAIAQKGNKRVQDLYRPIKDLLDEILDSQPAIPESLRELSRIKDFDLFVSTTFDDLLVKALNASKGGMSRADEIIFAPSLPGAQQKDIPEIPPSNYCAVFYLFGKASHLPFYAIHDEDILEFLYNLQAERGNLPERMLAEIRNRNMLLIGCNFPEWLNRFFIRLSNLERLSRYDRPKKEFLVDRELVCNRNCTIFYERFSENTRLYPDSAKSFVNELVRRWTERHPADESPVSAAQSIPLHESRSGEIFISYAREDISYAQNLYEELDHIGSGIIWFDKSSIMPGDVWENNIKTAISKCSLFLALVSSTTEHRNEGVFRKEWKMAVQRNEGIQGKRFIYPIVLDREFNGNTETYRLIPEAFRAFHFSHAPGGHMAEDLKKHFIDVLREIRRRRAV